jgi:hypothetical protein
MKCALCGNESLREFEPGTDEWPPGDTIDWWCPSCGTISVNGIQESPAWAEAHVDQCAMEADQADRDRKRRII